MTKSFKTFHMFLAVVHKNCTIISWNVTFIVKIDLIILNICYKLGVLSTKFKYNLHVFFTLFHFCSKTTLNKLSLKNIFPMYDQSCLIGRGLTYGLVCSSFDLRSSPNWPDSIFSGTTCAFPDSTECLWQFHTQWKNKVHKIWMYHVVHWWTPLQSILTIKAGQRNQ